MDAEIRGARQLLDFLEESTNGQELGQAIGPESCGKGFRRCPFIAQKANHSIRVVCHQEKPAFVRKADKALTSTWTASVACRLQRSIFSRLAFPAREISLFYLCKGSGTAAGHDGDVWSNAPTLPWLLEVGLQGSRDV